MKQKTNRLHFSTRTLAMVLSIVMLIGSIATGSMLNTFAAYLKDNVNSDAVSQAASEGSDIAKSAIPSQDADAAAQADNEDKPDLSGFEENEIVRGLKNDLVALGAGANLAATGLGSGDGIHLGIGTTATTWHGMGSDAYEFTLQSATTIYYTFSVSGGNFGKGNQGNPGANSQESYTYYANKNDNSQFSISLPAGTYKFKLKGIQSSNSNCLEYQFWKVSSGGGGDEPTPSGDDTGDTTGTKINDNDLIAVLKRTKIMIYFGDKWGSGTKYVKNGTSATSNATSGTSETLTIDNSNCYVANGYIATDAKYSISNQESSWAGMQINSGNNMTTSQSGNLYYMYNDGSNKLVAKDSTVTVSWSKDSDTIINGTSACGIKATVSGKTGANRDVSVKYFYTTDGTNFYTFNPASTSSMASGTYTIYAAAYDSKVYVAAATQGTLTIKTPVASSLSISASPTELTAVDQTSTITVTATGLASGVNNLTYTIYDREDDSVVGNPVTVTNGAATATFTVTPNARTKSYYASVKPTTSAQQALFDEVWTSSDATITNSADEYIPRYTVTFGSNNNSYGTVTAKDGSGNAITSGASVKEGDSVTFTATAKTGYVFTGWSGFETQSTSVTRVIRANTTATGNFGPKGYKVLAGNDSTNNMKELPNGTYISTVTYNHGAWFELVRNATGQRTVASENTQGVTTNTKYNVTSWEDGTTWRDSNVFKIYDNIGDGYYIVYDPATDEIWITKDPDDLYDVHVVAKDGTIRYGYKTTADYTQVFGDTTVELVSPASITGTVDANAYDGMAVAYNLSAEDVRNGVTLKIKTQTKETYVSQGYYVKGFVVSGYEESFSVLWQEFVSSDRGAAEEDTYDDRTWIHTGYNEFELTIDGYPEKNIEITPVYAIRETTSGDNIRFYVEGFAGEVYKEWGGTLAIDAYSTGTARKFGEYPGQPMINYNGRYVVDLPREGITGITLNNYVWDRIHSNLFYGTTGTATGHEATVKAVNYQTYDFNDFVYLKQVMDASHEDEDIIFSFRHRTSDDYDTKETSQLGKSTYYVNSPNASADKDYDYRKVFNTIDINNSIYQWEDLTDFYGNRVDIFGDYVDTKNSSGSASNPKAAYTNPIRIVSNGYDYNKAGNYATAWALYEPVDASGNPAYTGEFDHYQLIDVFGGQGIVNTDYSLRYDSSSYLINPQWTTNLRDKYDDAYAHDSSQTHSGATFVYDLAKVPTVISYEYQVKDGFSNQNLENKTGDGEPAYRSDGRWFTSSSDQLLTAHTIIEYAEKDEESLYHRDYYQGNGIDYTSASGYDPTDHTGLATDIQAYFENDDSVTYMGQDYQNTSGNTQAYAMSDGEHEFLLKAEDDPNGEYLFKGWYMYTNGKYSLVSRDKEYASEATANDVYVARYYKVPSGNLTISHKIDSSSTGTGHTYISAKITDSSNQNTIKEFEEVENGPLTIGPTYIKNNSQNNLVITLRTTPDKFSEFTQFLEYINTTVGRTITDANGGLVNDYAYVDITSTTTEITAEIRFVIHYLFDSNTQEQLIKNMPFTSVLTLPEYKYKIRYQYPAYNPSFGDQAYTVTGTFTEDELNDFMDYNAELQKLSLSNDSTKQDTFISNHAPYEDNFMQTISFSHLSFDQETYTKSTHLYELSLICSSGVKGYVYPTFNFAYAVDSSYRPVTTTVDLGNDTTEDRVIADNVSVPLSGRRIFEWVVTSGKTTTDGAGGDPVFIKAPLVIYSDDNASATPQYFKYWSVSTDSTHSNQNMYNKEFTRCYDANFNLSLFQDCIITPVYDSTPFDQRGMVKPVPTGNTEYDYSRFDPDIQKGLDQANGVTISFIENSRNQYNYGECGNVTDPKRTGAGDRIYSDFVLSYNNVAGGDLLQDYGESKKCGLIIESVADLASNDNGYYTQAESVYRTAYGDTLSNIKTGHTKAELETFITGGSSAKLSGTAKSEFNAGDLDNKNRMQYYYSLANRTHVAGSASNKTMPEGVYTNSNHKVFRAYAYIADYSNRTYSNVKISEIPVYFTIYDMGSIAIGETAN